jgi:hypothetical protein
MSEDESVPFSIERPRSLPQEAGAQVRKVAGAAEVIDISAMIRELEANPDARRRQ